MIRKQTWFGLALGLAMTTVASAAPQLVISEIYMGVAGNDVTADWFEITNFGDMSWDLGANPLSYDDDSAAVGDATAINNISQIAPNESVVVLIGTAADIVPFFNAWDDSGQLTGVQIGYTDGSGLGQGSDGVTIFDDLTPPSGNIVALQNYADIGVEGSTLIYNPDTQTFEGNAHVGVFGAYAAPGGPAGDSGEFPLIGSPGTAVPEPSTLALLGLTAVIVVRRRR
ncbi:MAG TPA: PEP-CTERM sorting domain-containing protein [Phycisphaerae bacterium]|nr:lamin tail domain-containing protein [Phycisphaerales bacterium]HRX87242.1 PEP-CTERM sorting domain-containing protein [Phycisphaerae bacterium]